MGQVYDAGTHAADVARDWIVRLTSGDMTEIELRDFRRWVGMAANEDVFRHELGNWRKLEAIRDRLSPTWTPSGESGL